MNSHGYSNNINDSDRACEQEEEESEEKKRRRRQAGIRAVAGAGRLFRICPCRSALSAGISSLQILRRRCFSATGFSGTTRTLGRS